MGQSALQAVGPVALVSLLLNDGLTKAIPGAELNANPNRPAEPQVQLQYNHAAIQVCNASCCLATKMLPAGVIMSSNQSSVPSWITAMYPLSCSGLCACQLQLSL